MTESTWAVIQLYTGKMRNEICAAGIALGHKLPGCENATTVESSSSSPAPIHPRGSAGR